MSEQSKNQKQTFIEVRGAREHNLKNINARIPRYALTVITGLSGSGKSSLAFDTIYAEGQRRYMETFSAYARSYIGNMQRPDVDKITGLSPVISIDQRTTVRNPRSTVGTITEIYDFLRLLYARAADAYSYLTGEKMVHYTDEQIISLILEQYAGKRVLILAPVVQNRKGHYKELFEQIRHKGFIQARVDGELVEVTQGMKLDRYKNHTIEIVIDKLKLTGDNMDDTQKRLYQSLDKAMQQGGGMIMVCEADGQNARFLSRNLMCPTTGISYREPAPHTFSFNSPQGWCPRCKGLGRIKVSEINSTASANNDELNDIVHDDSDWYKRMLEYIDQAKETDDDDTKQPEQDIVCPDCQGKRLSKEALSYRLGDKNIAALSEMDINQLLAFICSLQGADSPIRLSERQQAIAMPIIREIETRLRFMQQVGLTYLSLSRPSDSLSGGESQRIRLATQIGSRLVNVLYILDEPSIGLHQRDNQRLIDSLKQLRDMGNTVIVVEHDEQMMREADYVLDIGPRAGRLGGELIFQGTPAELLKADTLTAQYLRGEKFIPQSDTTVLPAPSTADSDVNLSWLTLSGCSGNNLKNVTLRLPLGKMVCITGVSGSGKSTLINRTLYPILSQHFYRSLTAPMPYESIEGLDLIDKVINVDQSPIGRTPRSNPATYTNVFTDIRELFASLPESKIRGWKQNRFSFNAKGGRCEECAGNGYKTLRMHFMPDIYTPCDVCGGARYNRQTLEVRFKGKTISDILDMTVNQAVEFFEAQPYILRKIKSLQDVGLGYIKLGQSSTTLSGGESQRVKLATELARPSTGKTIYILDEPTTGLHFDDVNVLMGVLHKLVDKGNTVIIIEHNLDVIRTCDYIIDLGPEGGNAGGQIIAQGTVAQLRQQKGLSITARYI
ncbi:MAG: excinuclease ABC subunit UvrA [Paludibacteraceae bacterium]|nr:excinuclease ABC subunit UvrA [Paludibacteraceae bacterium]